MSAAVRPDAAPADRRTPRQQLLSLQYLRAVAAILVVFHHVRNPPNGLFNPISHWDFGQAGVDMFFLISGYIMYSVARTQQPISFLRRRIIRIVPLYWIATLFLYFQVSIGFPGFLPSFESLVKSLLFIPQFHPQHPAQIWPFLVPGWTLQYEMYFYAIFAVGLAFKRLLPIALAFGGSAVVAGQLGLGDQQNAVIAAYTSPIITEFFQGMLIALVHQRRSFARYGLALPAGIIALLFFGNAEAPRLLIWGLPCSLILIGCLATEDAGKMPDLPIVKLLGDASYSIYLSHMFVLQTGLLVWWRVPVQGWAQFLIFTPTAVVGCVIVGILIFRHVEQPILQKFQRRNMPVTV
jgi:exopolysaccharide production protein ExoZ